MATTRRVDILVTKRLLLGSAELLVDRVARVSRDLGLGVREDLAVLHVEALDISELARSVSVELRHDSHLLIRVDGEPGTVEGLVALAPGVEVAAVRVAGAAVAVVGVGPAAAVARANVGRVVGTGVRRVGRALAVGLPDVHLSAASTQVADAGVGVAVRGIPALNVGLATNELDITGALAVAVASSVPGTSVVVLIRGLASILLHLRKGGHVSLWPIVFCFCIARVPGDERLPLTVTK